MDISLYDAKRAIADYKRYDKRRQKYLRELETENATLKIQAVNDKRKIDTLYRQLETLIDSYDRASLLLDNSGNKAYVKELLDQIHPFHSAMSTQSLEAMPQSALAQEVLNLRKGMKRMMQKIEEQNKELKLYRHDISGKDGQ